MQFTSVYIICDLLLNLFFGGVQVVALPVLLIYLVDQIIASRVGFDRNHSAFMWLVEILKTLDRNSHFCNLASLLVGVLGLFVL